MLAGADYQTFSGLTKTPRKTKASYYQFSCPLAESVCSKLALGETGKPRPIFYLTSPSVALGGNWDSHFSHSGLYAILKMT